MSLVHVGYGLRRNLEAPPAYRSDIGRDLIIYVGDDRLGNVSVNVNVVSMVMLMLMVIVMVVLMFMSSLSLAKTEHLGA